MSINEITEEISNLFENMSIIKEKIEIAFQEGNEEELDALVLEYNQKVKEKIDLLKAEKVKIENELANVEAKVKKYTLVPRGEIIDPEEEKEYISAVEILEAFEKDLFARQGDVNMIKSMINKVDSRKIVKKKQLEEETVRKEEEESKE